MDPLAPAKTLTLAMSNAGDDDDDDFQNPSHAVAITQNLILSRAPKSSNGAPPPRKRQKPGKENRRSGNPRISGKNTMKDERRDLFGSRKVSEEIGDSRISCVGIERSDFSASVELKEEGSGNLVSNESDLGEIWNSEVSTLELSRVCSTFEEHEPIREETKPVAVTLNDSQIVESSKIVDGGKLEDDKPKVVEKLQNGEFGKKSCYSMSIESRLLGSRVKPITSTVGIDCGDFNPGTQLKALMDLCCEGGSSGSKDLSPEGDDLGFESTESIVNECVECPLCGNDITDLSEDLRQVHTNECLDKGGNQEVDPFIGEMKSDAPQKLVDVNPVVEWLRKLDLSRYEEAFVKEEVDWETLQWLTEEDLLNIGVTALGPRKKIIHALNNMRQKSSNDHPPESDTSNKSTNKKTKLCVTGNKMITEFFQGSGVRKDNGCSINRQPRGLEGTTNDSASKTTKKVAARSHVSRGKVQDIPPWCSIPGTPFRVDAFRFLRGDCSHWFLTHFHMDHYQGLTRNFCHGKIYCSSITAHLVNMKIGVPWERLHVLPLNQKVSIAGVNLTCLDANHCPGSIIILFEPPSGKAVLHTGDFRFSEEMATSSLLQTCHVDTLILDTTYCNSQYDFPKQEAVIQFVLEAIQAEAFNPKTLFLIGSYTIGKERLFIEVARLLRKKVYVGAAKLRILKCLGLPEEHMQWFTENEMESHIHVVPMWTIASFKRMKHISNHYSNRFNLIVAFSPTGWTFGKGKKKTPGRRWQQGTIIRYEVPYSEHCSFTELKEFVRFISPDHIIPSVNNEGPESADAMTALLISDP